MKLIKKYRPVVISSNEAGDGNWGTLQQTIFEQHNKWLEIKEWPDFETESEALKWIVEAAILSPNVLRCEWVVMPVYYFQD